MAKLSSVVAGGMADVSTEYPTAPAGAYSVRIDNVEMGKTKKPPPRDQVVITTAIQDEERDGVRVKGIQIKEYITLQDVDGAPNEMGLRNLKRVVEQTLGKDVAADPDFDTDQLINWTGVAQVDIDSYTDGNGQDRTKNVVKKYLG